MRGGCPAELPSRKKLAGHDSDDQFEEILDGLRRFHIEATIHADTKTGLPSPAHWHSLAKARRRLPFPVIANGELWNPSDIARCAEVSGCDAFMLARGALCRPDLGAAVQALYSGSPEPDFGWEDARAMLVDFLETNLRLYDTRYAINPVKQWLVYLKVYYPQAAALFAQVKRITDPDTMADALAKRDALLNAA